MKNMATSDGIKISQLTQDDQLTGTEMIPISDNGVTKFTTVAQLLKSGLISTNEHEVEQTEYIGELQDKIGNLLSIINNLTTYGQYQKTDNNGNLLYVDVEGNITTENTGIPYVQKVNNTEDDIWTTF